MVSLLVTVFIIQLICHLVLTIGSKPINDLVRSHPATSPFSHPHTYPLILLSRIKRREGCYICLLEDTPPFQGRAKNSTRESV